MLSVVLYCQCLVINVRGAAVDVSSAPVAFAAAAAGAGEVPSPLGSMLMSSLVEMLNLLVVAGAALSTAVAGLAKLPPRVVFAVLSFVIKPLFSVVTEFPFLELFRSMRGVFWSCVNPLFQLGILSCSTLRCSFLIGFVRFLS